MTAKRLPRRCDLSIELQAEIAKQRQLAYAAPTNSREQLIRFQTSMLLERCARKHIGRAVNVNASMQLANALSQALSASSWPWRGGRMRKFPLYLSQDEVEALAQLLYTHQHVIDVVSADRPTSDQSFRFLSELRRQCCQRSKAEDPYPDLPMIPNKMFEEPQNKRRGIC